MTGALIILGVTVLVGLALFITHRNEDDDRSPTIQIQEAKDEECCGRHVVCEKGDISSSAPEYFDDEELDRFAGREQDAYEDEEVEEFREVLYSLLPEDVYPWGVSLTARDIALPTELRDEWVMLCEKA